MEILHVNEGKITLIEALKKDKFVIERDHNIPYKEHSYIILKSIINDYFNLNKNTLGDKLSNYI